MYIYFFVRWEIFMVKELYIRLPNDVKVQKLSKFNFPYRTVNFRKGFVFPSEQNVTKTL